MAKKIVARDIKEGHPVDMKSTTDMYYAKVGNMLLNEAFGCRMSWTLSPTELHDVVVKVVLYFEDIICDGGLWRAFVNKHQELYGKPLPFYDVEGEYFADEPHVEDIRLLIWDVLSGQNLSDMVHPEEEVIMNMADAFYEVLEAEFENAPINEDMKRYYEEAAFMDDFIRMRVALQWLFANCYLTRHEKNEDYFIEYNSSLARMMHLDEEDDRAIYASTNQVIFKAKIGMLALLPQEWLALLMEANGHSQHAETLRAVEFRDYQVYLLDGYDDVAMRVRGMDDEVLSIRLDGYSRLNTDMLENVEGCIASYVRFKGGWQPNGMDSWGRYRKTFEEKKEEKARYKKGFAEKNFKKIMKQTGGSPLVYLRDGEEVRRFLMDGIGVPQHLMQPSKLDDEKEIVAWVPNCDDGPFFSFGCTSAICDPRNPFYVKDERGEDSLELIVNPELSEDTMARYLIEHGMLPDAAFDDCMGKERGRQLVQENLDFIARSYRRSYY